MLAERPVSGNARIAALLRLAQRLAGASLVLDVGLIALLFERRFPTTIGTGAVGANGAAGVGRVENGLELLAVVHARWVAACCRIKPLRLSVLACSL